MRLSYKTEPMRGNLIKIDSPLLVHLVTIVLHCGTTNLVGKVLYMPPNGWRYSGGAECGFVVETEKLKAKYKAILAGRIAR